MPCIQLSNSLLSADERAPIGFCQCGCGEHAPLARSTCRREGRLKGIPVRFLPGHQTRARVRAVEVPTGYPTPCRLWQLAKTRDGYGKVKAGGRSLLAHHLAYQQEYGPIPRNTQLDHLCHVRSCINPQHLEPVTAAENVRRSRCTRLSSAHVAAIRASSDPQYVLARRFGVSQGHISAIKSGKSWRP